MHLAATVGFIKSLCNPACSEGLDEDAKVSFSFMVDNSISTLVKIVIFQKDGAIVDGEIVKNMLEQLPLKTDQEEAQSIHKLLLAKVLEKNPALMEFPGDLKAALKRMEAFSNEHPDEHEDILDDEGRALFSQVISQM